MASEIRKFSLGDFKIDGASRPDDDWLNATVFSLRPGSERHLKYSRVTFNSDCIASPLKERGGCHPVLSGKSLPVSGKNFPFYERPMIRDATATGNW